MSKYIVVLTTTFYQGPPGKTVREFATLKDARAFAKLYNPLRMPLVCKVLSS